MKKLLTILLTILLLAPLFVFGQTQIKFSQINPTLPANYTILNNGKQFALDSLYLASPATYATPTGSIVFYGTSITVGTGVTTGGTKYSTQVANALGYTETNLGTSGAHVVQNGDGFGFQDHESSIPTYSAGSTRWLVVETGPNDFNNSLGASQYQTDLTTFINYCITTKGWPASKILMLNNSYIDPGRYNGTTLTLAIYQTYQAATLAVANAKGTLYFDLFSWFSNRGALFNMYDVLHPNNYGHTLQANGVLTVLSPAVVYKKGHALEVNSTSDLSKLNFLNSEELPDNGNTVLGRDSTGKVANIGALPNNIRFAGDFWLNGRIKNQGIVTTATPAAQDWLLGQQKIYAQYSGNSAYYTTTTLASNNVGYEFRTSYNNSGADLARFYNGAGVMALEVQQNGDISNAHNYYTPTGNIGFYAYTGSYVVGFTGFSSSFGTLMTNAYTNGYLGFEISNGVTNTRLEAARFSNKGSFLLGGTTDDNFRLDVEAGNARFQGSTNFGRLSNATLTGNPTTSTSGGTLAAGTYWYYVVVLDAFGNESYISTNQGTVTTTGSTSSNTISWSTITGNYGYRIYRGTSSGGEDRYITAAQGATSIVDIGSGYTTKALPTVNSTTFGSVSSTGAAGFVSESLNSTQTSVNGSTSGTAVFSEPQQGTSYKVVIIKMATLIGTASYTFPIAFSTTPSVVATDDVAAAVVTSKSTSAVTVTGSTTTGTLMLIGY